MVLKEKMLISKQKDANEAKSVLLSALDFSGRVAITL